MNIGISYYTACGAREHNEDYITICERKNGLLAILADGLGGHRKGEVASHQAVETLSRCLQDQPVSVGAMEQAVQQANHDVCLLQRDGLDMKTTITAVWMDDFGAVAANVGDSRIYQIRNGEIVFQSLDHSVAQMAVLVGEIGVQDIRMHPDRNRLIRALGMEGAARPELNQLAVKPGDRLLLCSDGFWELCLEKEMIAAAWDSADAAQWLKQMRAVVESRQPDDNHSAIALVVKN